MSRVSSGSTSCCHSNNSWSRPHPPRVGSVCASSGCEVCVCVCVCVPMCWPSYQWESVGDFAVGGQLSAEAIGRKELVAVVVLDYLTHCFQSHGIRIHLVGTHIVEGGGLGGVPLEEDTHTHTGRMKRITSLSPQGFHLNNRRASYVTQEVSHSNKTLR